LTPIFPSWTSIAFIDVARCIIKSFFIFRGSSLPDLSPKLVAIGWHTYRAFRVNIRFLITINNPFHEHEWPHEGIEYNDYDQKNYISDNDKNTIKNFIENVARCPDL